MVPPQPDLVGMDAELARDLGDRLLPLGRFKSHICLEGRVVRLPHIRKHTIPPFEIWQTQNPLIPPVQFLESSSVSLDGLEDPSAWSDLHHCSSLSLASLPKDASIRADNGPGPGDGGASGHPAGRLYLSR